MKVRKRTAETFKENDMIFTSKINFGAKKVQGDYGVRPNQAAIVQTGCKWIIGDVTEVLDRNTWKLGKILKMLKNNYFVIRLADCIQLKEFHISSLRIPHAPGAPHSKQIPAAEKATGRGKRQPADRAKASQQIGHQTYGLERNGKKRRAAADGGSHRLSKRTRPRHVAATSNLNGCLADSSYLHSPSQDRDEAECSVASCSVNDLYHFDASGSGSGKRHAADGLASRCFPDDAMSACPCTSSGEGHEGRGNALVDEGVDVHVLELEAYRSTVRALYASGPLTWEQESLLTNLRLSLNISNEEHLLQLRRLLSSS